MLKVFADKVFRFSRGERNSSGHLMSHTTKIGFCELPDWVEKTDLFQLALKDKAIRVVESASSDEQAVKEHEELLQLRAELAELKQKMLLQETPAEETDAKEPDAANESAEEINIESADPAPKRTSRKHQTANEG